MSDPGDPPEAAWGPGGLARLGDRRAFKVGLVLGPSRSPGRTRIRSFSASARSWSNPLTIATADLQPIPPRHQQTPWQARVIAAALVESVAQRRDPR